MTGDLININEFMPAFADYLQQRGLMIVPTTTVTHVAEQKLKDLQARLLKKQKLTFKEVLDAKLLPVTTKQGIESWIERGTLNRETDIFKSSKNVRYIMTAAIKRIHNLDY